ncbi:hypothetical protein [Anaerospora sp.]|uniref:tetratricopeptide repeat protein n=1 Tax=Anaerospora sp. TaxID=1960278 RepID=UPI00289A7DC9|nr:hypothetical protein [Anaerospora sp.]
MEYTLITTIAIVITTLFVHQLANRILGVRLGIKPLALCGVCSLFLSLILPRIVVGFAGLAGTIGVLAVFAIIFAYFVAYYEDSFQGDSATHVIDENSMCEQLAPIISTAPPFSTLAEDMSYITASHGAVISKHEAREVPIAVAGNVPEPVVEEPVAAEEPVLEELVAEEPVVEEPMAEEPVIEELVTEEPVIEELVTEEPVIEELVAEEPVVEELVTEEPVIEELVAEEPVIEEPAVEEPVVEEPVAEEPVIEELVTEEPVIEELVAEEPVIEELVAEEPVIEELVTEEPIVNNSSYNEVTEVVCTMNQQMPKAFETVLPDTQDLDTLLDYAFSQKENKEYEHALSAFRHILQLFPEDSAAPFITIEIGNILKLLGSYDDAIQVFVEGKTSAALQDEYQFEQEFINTIAYLRIIKNTLIHRRLGLIPYHKIPTDVLEEINAEFREWRNLI